MPVFAACIHLPGIAASQAALLDGELKEALYNALDEAGVDYKSIGIGIVREEGDLDKILDRQSPPDGLRKVRTTDPDTSRAAAFAAAPRAGTQRHLLLEAVRRHGEEGLTADQAASITGIRLNAASTRMSELQQGGWIEDSGQRRVTSGGQPAIVYVKSSKAGVG